LFPQRLQRYLAFELGCELSSLFHWLLYFNSVKQPVQLYGAGSIVNLHPFSFFSLRISQWGFDRLKKGATITTISVMTAA
ncbi:hypothetical protein, partial [Coraliomargarita parva]|uniref:hypothetical protein n=1 Tax=Coraliomargarita parva TaxID=3014050 RepID=UPI0022B31428